MKFTRAIVRRPGGSFVEDTAIMTARGAILMRPGAPSREGEARGMAQCLRSFYAELPAISAPGTVDGGDICEADGHFLIGLSARTNEQGARQLAGHPGPRCDRGGVRGSLRGQLRAHQRGGAGGRRLSADERLARQTRLPHPVPRHVRIQENGWGLELPVAAVLAPSRIHFGGI